MTDAETLIAIFPDHAAAENGVKALAQAGFELKSLSVVGKGYHTEEKVVGFYNLGDRVKFWGQRGAFWGGLRGLFVGGAFITTPLVGPVFVLGYLVTAAISAVEGALVVGGLSAIGAALYSIGVPHDSVVVYETALKAEQFLVMAHVATSEIARARATLRAVGPSRLDVYANSRPIDAKTDASLVYG